MLVEQTKENPFRPQLMGRTRLIFVCADEIKLVHNRRESKYFVTPSPSELSFKLARAEMHSYHYPPEEMGKPVQAMRPEKKKGMDNFIDTLRGFATRWGPSVAPMSKDERRVHHLPAHLQPAEVLSHIGTPAFVELYMEQQQTLIQARLHEEREERATQQAWAKVLGGRAVSHGRRRHGRIA